MKFTNEDFINSIDWVSLVPDMNFDEFCEYLELYDFCFSKRHIFNTHYVVVDKSEYAHFYYMCKELNLLNKCHISRIDLKFDFEIPYNEFYEQHKDELKWNKGIALDRQISTIYFNERNDPLFVRIYDKQKEKNLKSPLTRVEYEFKGTYALEFSARWSERGIDDALNFLKNKIVEFNYYHGVDCIMPHLDFVDVIPITIPLNEWEDRQKFLHFLHQYSNSIKHYIKKYGEENFISLVKDYSDFETRVPYTYNDFLRKWVFNNGRN